MFHLNVGDDHSIEFDNSSDLSSEIVESETSLQETNTHSDGITELLIAEIAKRPPLYNEKLPLIQRSRSIKKALMLEIASVLNGILTIEEIDKKWNYLKKEYRKQKAVLSKYLKSGCSYDEAAAIVGKPVWKHFLSLRFIDDPRDERVTFSNIVEGNRAESLQLESMESQSLVLPQNIQSGPTSSGSVEEGGSLEKSITQTPNTKKKKILEKKNR